MGLYDRHYVRRIGASHPPRSGLRAWSGNTWIIVLCVAVFMIDSMLPMRFVTSGRTFILPGVEVDQSQLVVEPAKVERVVDPRTGRGVSLVVNHGPERDPESGQPITTVPLLAYSGGPHVGWAEVFPMRPLESWLYFNTYRGFFKCELWRLIGFQFLHAGASHLLFNMLGLFFLGPFVEHYLGRKRYLAFYLLCGIFGALMYLLLNLLSYFIHNYAPGAHIPGLLPNNITTPLVGASAGVFGVLMAGAFIAPNEPLLLFYVIPMRMRTLAYGLFLVALGTVFFGGHNAGGEAAHIGGAVAGFYFIRHPHHLHGFFDFVGRADPTSHHYRGRAVTRAVDRGGGRGEIDRILDKINSGGLQSLTDQEKRALREASEQP